MQKINLEKQFAGDVFTLLLGLSSLRMIIEERSLTTWHDKQKKMKIKGFKSLLQTEADSNESIVKV